MLEYAVHTTNEYIEKMPKSQRKVYGQFFTSMETAAYMASLFDAPIHKERVTLLDTGAGSGILSIALIERLQACDTLRSIRLVCYETDAKIVELLRKNLNYAAAHSAIQLEYEVREDNYILSQQEEYNQTPHADPSPEKFDMVIGNPPYKKIPKDAPEAQAMPDVCYGAPNMYFLFTAMGLFNMKDHGEMVYIIPRSWASGAYFKRFRHRLLQDGVLENIHLFISRDKVFEKESVLQETIIIKIRKSADKPEKIMMTTSQSNKDFPSRTVFEAPYDTVVSNDDDRYVFLVSNKQDIETLATIRQWNNTLPSLGLKMKTGLTVDFRNWESLRDNADAQAVPLFYAQHIKNGRVVFPAGKEREFITTDHPGLLQNNSNYLFVKRFTAKEEPRRLQSGVYLAKKLPAYAQISTQNKINFICGAQELSECIVYGLYVLFNSTLYDSYYRILNGSTQVNSTEVNNMPVPDIDDIEAMGKVLMQSRDMTEKTCDQILRGFSCEQNNRSQGHIERIASAS